MKLQEALTSLATSPVSKDREAITRIERITGEDINTIIGRLENESVLVNVLEGQLSADTKQQNMMLIASCGLMCGGLCCLLMILIRPNFAILSAPVGLVTGAAAESVSLLRNENARKRNSYQIQNRRGV
ncbi:hypothetical protein A6S26_05505 [Nostoc sp. ATCC 43529]|nr:hypothetical protein A6S26_05505 [Nostoc sp. ATCC 43529]